MGFLSNIWHAKAVNNSRMRGKKYFWLFYQLTNKIIRRKRKRDPHPSMEKKSKKLKEELTDVFGQIESVFK